jgi:hypothetical protein
MEKAFLTAFFILLAIAAAIAMALGYIQIGQILYVAKLIAGWTAWTCAVALIYAGLEKLFPDVLCAPAEDS